MSAWASVLPRSRRVGGTRIKGMPRWLNSTSMVLRSQIARIARLQTSLDIVHTSLEIGVNETMEITELSAQKPCALRQWEVTFTHTPIIAHHLSFVVPAAAFIQHTRVRSPRPSGLGRNATVQGLPFPLLLFFRKKSSM